MVKNGQKWVKKGPIFGPKKGVKKGSKKGSKRGQKPPFFGPPLFWGGHLSTRLDENGFFWGQKWDFLAKFPLQDPVFRLKSTFRKFHRKIFDEICQKCGFSTFAIF